MLEMLYRVAETGAMIVGYKGVEQGGGLKAWQVVPFAVLAFLFVLVATLAVAVLSVLDFVLSLLPKEWSDSESESDTSD